MRTLSHIVLICFGVGATAAAAQTMQAIAPIRDAALAAVQAGPGAEAVVASGLRLVACRQPLAATASSSVLAEVRCPDTPGWRLYVPIRAATGDAARLERDVGQGEYLVRRGDPVVLRAAVAGGEVRMSGKALGQARVGGILNVENGSSHRIIRGRLASDGTVEVVN